MTMPSPIVIPYAKDTVPSGAQFREITFLGGESMTLSHRRLLMFSVFLAALFTAVGSANGQTILIDDFSDGNDDG